MPYNAKSRENLIPGARKGVKQRATKDFVEHLVKFLVSRFPDVQDAFDQLSPKEKVAAWAKLADRFMPRPEAEQPELPNGGLVQLITQLVGEEKPQPLLDIVQLQQTGYHAEATTLGAEGITASAPPDEAGVIDI